MRATELLSALGELPYGERVQLIAEHARRLRGTAELAALIAELDIGETFARTVGLELAQIAGDVEHITKLLTDPQLQGRALTAVGCGVPVSDDALQALYSDAPAALRARILTVIRRTRRQALAVQLIDEQRDRWGDHAAAGLLSSADTATVNRLLPDLGYTLTSGEWARLAARHPEAVLDHASRTMPEGIYRTEWWDSVGYGVVEAIDQYPERVVELIRVAAPQYDLPQPVVKVIGKLADLDPAGLLQLLTAPDRASALQRAFTPALRRRLYRLADDDLVAIGRNLWPNVAGLLSDLPPARRSTVFEGVTATIELGRTALSDKLLAVLPRRLRHEYARRMIELFQDRDPRQQWEYSAYLPFAEAFARLEPEVNQPEAGARAVVYRAVITSAGHSREPASIEQALSWATRVRNDQDPVREAVLDAAASLPPSQLTDLHVDALQTLLTDALEARDLSWLSGEALNSLAETAIRQGALGNHLALLGWGVAAQARLAEYQGEVELYGLVDGLPRGREVAVYEALRPHVEAAAARKEFELAFAVAEAFGRRGWTNTQLHDVLEQAVWSKDKSVVERATQLWLQPTATRAERTGRIIDYKVGMARWDSVWAAVTEGRTDLVDRVFAKPDKARRFDRNRPAWRVSTTALRRWLPHQHSRYAELVAAAANDTRIPEWTRAKAVSTLGRIPGAGQRAVEPFLSNDSVLLQEAALAAVVWTDQPELALPVLLAHAGDDRARVALSAASRAARFVRPSLLVETFRPVLVGEGVKVTSRKEAARLLGVLRAPGASEVLAEAWADAHRDVRAAITSVASQHLLHEPASWALLQEAVHDSPATAAMLIQRPPLSMATQYRSRYADLLIAATNRPETPTVGAALRSLAGWAPYNPAVAPVCAGFITDLANRSHNWSDAATALADIVAAGQARDELISVVRLLIRLESKPGVPNAESDRDHPARQRLTLVMAKVGGAVDWSTKQPLLDAAAELVAPEYLALRVHPLIWALDWTEPMAGLTAVADLIADRPLVIAVAAEQLRFRLHSPAHRTATKTLTPATELAATGRAVDGHLALAMVAAASDNTAWSPAWRDLLISLRNHPIPDVRYAALDLTTANEY
ncbi:hypothetical protein [Streptomyces sp. SID13031]|uniref:hypothetical protein n=1 Tax=Streptomyces sp. SID13031 TaxID=2706046 RepID=UPI0013C9BB7C|nr:hypothetical protein [Streptomyces sp. SID13031]NEA37181.1 hypothetical protein [Streptomyces sp. SID13031]